MLKNCSRIDLDNGLNPDYVKKEGLTLRLSSFNSTEGSNN